MIFATKRAGSIAFGIEGVAGGTVPFHSISQRCDGWPTWRNQNFVIYKSKFILDLFIFWVFPVRFLRWFDTIMNSHKYNHVTCLPGEILQMVGFYHWIFTWSHDFLMLNFWKKRLSSKCPSCHPAHPIHIQIFDILLWNISLSI